MSTSSFDLHEYDLYHLGVSGGKDSARALFWLRYESGIPLNKCIVTFNDTDNEDALTYAFIRLLSERVMKIQTINPELGFWDLARKKKRFPSAKARFCTQALKVIPSMEFVAKIRSGYPDPLRILMLSGVRKEEGHSSNRRGTMGEFDHDPILGVDKFRPIYHDTLADVWAAHTKYLKLEWVTELIRSDPTMSDENKADLIGRMQAHGIPRNPLYDMQATRVGCFPCIHSRKLEVRAMAKYRPERVDFIEAREIELGQIRKKGGSNTHYSSMFARKTVPERFRSVPIVTKSGESMQVASIRDVVNWSHTSHGGKQYQMEFGAFDKVPPLACDAAGMCE